MLRGAGLDLAFYPTSAAPLPDQNRLEAPSKTTLTYPQRFTILFRLQVQGSPS